MRMALVCLGLVMLFTAGTSAQEKFDVKNRWEAGNCKTATVKEKTFT